MEGWTCRGAAPFAKGWKAAPAFFDLPYSCALNRPCYPIQSRYDRLSRYLRAASILVCQIGQLHVVNKLHGTC
jgi:hypothetical protein